MEKRIITVAVSGYFNPLHIGHLDYLEAAKKLGDKLLVILNNDEQVKAKGSVPFMNEQDRLRIVSALKVVDEVVLSIDKGKPVIESLRKYKPDIFCNGGDQTEKTIPETEVCNELGIELVFGVGGNKARSSSTLITEAAEKENTDRN